MKRMNYRAAYQRARHAVRQIEGGTIPSEITYSEYRKAEDKAWRIRERFNRERLEREQLRKEANAQEYGMSP